MKMNLKHMMLAVAAVVAANGAQAMDAAAAKALATKSACMSCHAVDRKLVGPSYKDVAAKHKGEAGAVDKVAARIKSCASGMYGPIPMPAQPNLKPDELKLLAQWILAGAPDK
jgi:cytochrome c